MAQHTKSIRPREFILDAPGLPKLESMFRRDLLMTIRSGTVFFYPACGFVDWDAIKDFSGPFRAFFTEDFPYEAEAVRKFWKDDRLPLLMDALADRLGAVEPFDLTETEKNLRHLAEEHGVKAGLLINATRVALTGQAVAPSLFDVMQVMGRERVILRLRRAAAYLRHTTGSPTSPEEHE